MGPTLEELIERLGEPTLDATTSVRDLDDPKHGSVPARTVKWECRCSWMQVSEQWGRGVDNPQFEPCTPEHLCKALEDKLVYVKTTDNYAGIGWLRRDLDGVNWILVVEPIPEKSGQAFNPDIIHIDLTKIAILRSADLK